MKHMPVSVANFRMATLQARETPQRYDCVSSVDSLSSTPSNIFRGQVLAFFKLLAKDIGAPETDDVIFTLLGCFRAVRHTPYLREEPVHGAVDGPEKVVTRERLLGGPGHFFVKFPPNNITMKAACLNEWQSQRFKIVGLVDLKASVHMIPLTNREGDPLRASYVHDNLMHPTIPGAIAKQLFYLNTCSF